MDQEINRIIEDKEKIKWQGVINRNAMIFTLVFSLVIIAIIAGIFLALGTFDYTSNGVAKGTYIYVMYKADTNVNTELERRFRISEDVLKFVFINLGVDADQEAIVKAYKNPNHNSGENNFDAEKEKKMFSKRKSCYFSAKKTTPDWKDPSTYSWLVNEFGKISPARVTGLRPKYQRMATAAIKRGRCMGLISYMSNRTAR